MDYDLLISELRAIADRHWGTLHTPCKEGADAIAALRAEVERLREWEVFAAHEIATLKSSAGYLRDEIERRWQRAFERVGRALDAHEMAMERAKHDYDATLPAPPTEEE